MSTSARRSIGRTTMITCWKAWRRPDGVAEPEGKDLAAAGPKPEERLTYLERTTTAVLFVQASQHVARAGDGEVRIDERQVDEIPGERADIRKDHRLETLALLFDGQAGVAHLSDGEGQVPDGLHRRHDLTQRAIEVG